jgi:predicted CopG family antitoxin
MKKKLTITVDEEVYAGLHRVIGRRNISGFLERLARPHVVQADLDEAYAAMAVDEDRERDALEWAESTVGDIAGSQGSCDEAG